ncbi:MAG TPA: hypothetical protein VIS99_12700 [Terrimicrobiaceae bacterium]
MLLGSKKTDIDQLLGQPLMARNVVGLVGEKAFKYRQGDFDIVVGYLNELARYCAAVRRSGPVRELSSSELSVVLSLNAPAALWTVEVPESAVKTTTKGKPRSTPSQQTTRLQYVGRDPKVKEKVLCEIYGWMPARKGYAFFCLPAMDGQPPLLASEWAVNQALA